MRIVRTHARYQFEPVCALASASLTLTLWAIDKQQERYSRTTHTDRRPRTPHAPIFLFSTPPFGRQVYPWPTKPKAK